jgi:superfamily II DNA/RNA helicase
MTHTSAHAEVEKVLQRFSELNISSELKKSIKELGYITPTTFQMDIFDCFQSGKNIVGEGQSSYGKSLAFSLPILAKIATKDRQLQALIICENALQAELVAKECKALGRYLDIEVRTSLDFLGPEDKRAQILVLSCDDFIKADIRLLSTLQTVFMDNLSLENAKKALDQLHGFSLAKMQFLMFGKDTLAAFNEKAKDLLAHAIFVNNRDQPKIALSAKHIFHHPKETEPKPRALLAALELHKPKFALVTCIESQECDLLARYLARYGFEVRIVSEENNHQGMSDALREGLNGAYNVLLCQSSLIAGHSLDHIEFMINYDMFERPQAYEHTTQFHKQASGLQRNIVNLLTSREIGYLGPIKAQCLIDFSEIPLPSDDEVMTLCAKRIARHINRDARDIELAQFDMLAQKMFDDPSSRSALSLLLRNHLLQFGNLSKNETEIKNYHDRRSNRSSHDRKRPDRRDRNFNGSRPQEEEVAVAAQTTSQPLNNPDGITRLYVTLGRHDGFLDLASLAQYLSEKSTVDLGHFTGGGMLRDTSAHIEVDEDVALDIIKALHESSRPNASSKENEEVRSTVICEKARAAGPRPSRRPLQRRRPNFQRRQ